MLKFITLVSLKKLGLAASFLAVLGYLYQWQNPSVNLELRPTDEKSWYELIHSNKNCKFINIKSMGNELGVFYVENIQPGDPYGFALYFPAIEITTESNDVAWLQIVRTDAQDDSLKILIDNNPQDYPFYTRGQIFYDLPAWNYTFFTKPLTMWLAHAYAVEVNEQNKTIKCIGGISWGYTLSYFRFQPSMILPKALTKNDWQNDWQVYQKALFDYQDITQ